MAGDLVSRASASALPSIDRRSPAVLLPLALAFGVIAQLLFFGLRPGLNVAIATAGIVLVAWLVRPPGARPDPLDRWVAPAALIFGALPALRSDGMLLAFDLPVTVVLIAMTAVSFAGAPLTRRAADLLIHLGLLVIGRILAGGALLLAALPRVTKPLANRAGGRIGSIGAGLALALPLLIVFAVLFSSADAVFSKTVGDLVDLKKWSFGALMGRTVVAVIFAWLAGGLLVLGGRVPEAGTRGILPGLRGLVSSTATTTMLLCIDAVFLFFVALQLAYLFGGRDTLDSTGLTYSAYARRGFFELIAVATIVGALVFAVEVVVARRTRLYLGCLVALIAATIVIVVSAAYRMQLYQLAYGWTEQRFYALAGIAWLGLSGGAAIVLVARDGGRWLPHAAALVGLAVAIGANAVGPIDFVARQNLERVIDSTGLPADADRRLDLWYLANLGEAALPAMIEAQPRLPEPWRSWTGSYLRMEVVERDRPAPDVRELNLDRERARRAGDDAADRLRAYPPFDPRFWPQLRGSVR